MPKTLWTVLATLIVLALVAFCQAKGAPETRLPAALQHYQSASFRMHPLPEDTDTTTTTPPAPAPPPPTTHVESTDIPTAARPAPSPGPATSRDYSGSPAASRALGQQLAAAVGWTGSQWACLDTLWGVRESGWNVHDYNSSSGAYGIPQALPGSKMASAGADWRDNPATQIRWGLQYLRERWGTPCSGLANSYRRGWY